jgi:general secretion pathway protein A
MYLEFFGLKKEPFNITPDPEFLFLSPSHKEALGSIIYGIEKRKGFIAIVGGVGLGKTTVLRSYLDKADRSRLKIIYVFHANVSFENLLKTIYQELGLTIENEDAFIMVNKLHQFLIEEYRQGRNVVLIVDEAQNMPVETLENLRMLSNLETSSDKLIQIVLIGQTELDEMLKSQKLRQLEQRIAVRAIIHPLKQEESLAYINHRLSKAGMSGPPVFNNEALQLIAKQANGVPRIMNILCDNALITGFGYQVKPVNRKIAKEIILDYKGEKKNKFSFARWGAIAGSVFILLIAMFFFMYQDKNLNRPRAGTVGAVGAQPPLVKEKIEKPVEVVKEKTEQPQEILPKTQLTNETNKTNVTNETNKTTFVTITVKKGDHLRKLIIDVYGFVNNGLLESVHQNNPQIKDVNIIKVGERIVFPQGDTKLMGR